MQKIAQRRGILNRLRETINAPLGGAAEQFFNPQFSSVMESMREIDANARSIVAGKSLEKGDPGPDPVAFKDLLKSAKSNLNRREFMAAIADLSRFHKRIALLLSELAKFDSKVDEIHHQFLVKDVGDEHLDEIRNLKSRWAANRERDAQMLKEAGAISDFLKSWTDPRGRALRFYEKRYEKRVKPLKNGIVTAIRDGERLLSKILTSLQDMAAARATRNPDKYSDGIGKIRGAYGTYDAAFRAFYNGTVKPISDKLIPEKEVEQPGAAQPQVPAEEVDNRITDPGSPPAMSVSPSGAPTLTPSGDTEVPTYRPTGDTPVPGTSSIPRARPNEFGQDIEQYMQQVQEQQIGHAPTTPAPPGSIPQPPKAQTMIGVAPPANPPPATKTVAYGPGMTPPPHIPVLAHNKFYDSLETMSGEHPRILANYISKYAQSIQDTDPTTAIKLLQIAKSVRG